MSKKVYERITNAVIEKMEQGTVPWRRPWSGTAAKLGEHKNALTGKRYRGVNALLTHLSGFDSPKWLTYKQAKEKGGTVKKGEKGTPIVFWHWVEKEKDGKIEKIPFVRYYTVFNGRQIEGIEDEAEVPQEEIEFNPIEKAERLFKSFGDAPPVAHKVQKACYNKARDEINLPRKETFQSVEEYYSTLFHELTHSSGHENRLNRKSLIEIKTFGDHAHSKEELVAEMGSAFLCSMAGIEQKVLDNQAAYIDGWLTKLKKDEKLFISSAQAAQKAVDYMTRQPSL